MTSDLSNEPGEHFERQRGAERRGGVAVEAADKDGERAERILLSGIEELIAPLDSGADGSVVRGRQPASASEHAKLRLEASEYLLGGHDTDSCRRELDGQRQPVETLAQTSDRGVRVGAGQEIRLALPGPLHEDPVGVLGPERIDAPDRLSVDLERLAARGQYPDIGA